MCCLQLLTLFDVILDLTWSNRFSFDDISNIYCSRLNF